MVQGLNQQVKQKPDKRKHFVEKANHIALLPNQANLAECSNPVGDQEISTEGLISTKLTKSGEEMIQYGQVKAFPTQPATGFRNGRSSEGQHSGTNVAEQVEDVDTGDIEASECQTSLMGQSKGDATVAKTRTSLVNLRSNAKRTLT